MNIVYFQTLTDHFRLNYANMWMSILNADVEAIERNAKNLGVNGHLCGVLASMLTARAWKSIKAGIGNHSRSEKEVQIYITYITLG